MDLRHQFPTSALRHPPSLLCNLYLQSATAIIDERISLAKLQIFIAYLTNADGGLLGFLRLLRKLC